MVTLVANRGKGIDELRNRITETFHGKRKAASSIFANLPNKFQVEIDKLAARLKGNGISPQGFEIKQDDAFYERFVNLRRRQGSNAERGSK